MKAVLAVILKRIVSGVKALRRAYRKMTPSQRAIFYAIIFSLIIGGVLGGLIGGGAAKKKAAKETIEE